MYYLVHVHGYYTALKIYLSYTGKLCHICTRSMHTWYSVVRSARSMSLTYAYTPVEFAIEYTKDHTNLCGMCHPVGWQTDNIFYISTLKECVYSIQYLRVVILGHKRQHTHKQNYNIVEYA